MKINLLTLLIVITAGVPAFSTHFDLTVESIKDSSSFIEKIKLNGDPLHPYFSKGKAPETRNNLIAIVNSTVLPDPDFAWQTTQLDELKTTTRYKDMSPEKQEELLAKNRDLLTELYPDNILPRNMEVVKQGFELKITKIQPDTVGRLKAEVINFLNVIIRNEQIMQNWKNLRQFFREDVSDKEIEAFVIAMRAYNRKKIPVNELAVHYRGKTNEADIAFKSKDGKKDKNLFTLSVIPGKKWKILEVKNIEKDLLQAGYIEKKEVRK
jgi:hypothetical protein